jgi:hypothetical protein
MFLAVIRTPRKTKLVPISAHGISDARRFTFQHLYRNRPGFSALVQSIASASASDLLKQVTGKVIITDTVEL